MVKSIRKHQLFCKNASCRHYRTLNKGNIRHHGFYKTRQGKRRRYICKTCGKSFCNNTNTPYYRLQKSRNDFDQVASMTVEGVCKSSIARIKGFSRTTITEWQEKAAEYAELFSSHRLKNYELIELQADELRTFIDNKKKVKWIFTTMEVWTRLWLNFVVGNRSYKNTRKVLRTAIHNGKVNELFLFTTDGFEPYSWAVRLMLIPLCIYGQVIKKCRNNRVVQIDRKLVFGTEDQLQDALFNSEDSEKLNTSFIERLNLTIRQGSSYLNRRSICHARDERYLKNHLTLLQCYYNFIRPHKALKFGSVMRTPSVQAGIVKRKLSFRDILTWNQDLFLIITQIFNIDVCWKADFRRAA